jgi:hypothetical protein
MLSNYIIKVALGSSRHTGYVSSGGFLKRAEQEDYFDVDTDFTPFSIEV